MGLVWSDHAIVRYMERVKHLDLAKLKAEMIPDSFRRTLEKLGGTGTVCIDKYKVVVRDYVVVTVLVKDTDQH